MQCQDWIYFCFGKVQQHLQLLVSALGYKDASGSVVIVQLYRAQGFVDLVVGGAVTIHLSIYEKTICSERTHPRAYSITSDYELR